MATKKDLNKKLLLIPAVLIALFAVWALMNPSFFNDLSKTSSNITPTDEPREVITVYTENGTATSTIVIRKNDRFLMGNVKSPTGPAGFSAILENKDGKWIVIGDAAQAYPCTYFEGLGMTTQDINDLGILSRNGICLPRPSEDDFSNWNSNPSNFSDGP